MEKYIELTTSKDIRVLFNLSQIAWIVEDTVHKPAIVMCGGHSIEIKESYGKIRKALANWGSWTIGDKIDS